MAEPVLQAAEAARARGVRIRVVFNVDHARTNAADPPPPMVDWALVKRLGQIQPIPGVPDLMHHKYVVRDAGTAAAAVWTGSSNWTTDSWTREENVLVQVRSPQLAAAYLENFEELWTKKVVALTGHEDPAWISLESGVPVRAFFTPGRSPKLVHEIAMAISQARRRLRICSPVITSGPILGALAEAVAHSGLDIRGCYDGTQMAEVLAQWAHSPLSAWKIAAFKSITSAVPLGAKWSTPWQTGSVHDFMHAKTLVADDTVFVGSFNLSRSGESNAENVVQFTEPAMADRFATFIEDVAARYPATAPKAESPA